MRKVLVISVHPDDETIGAGGTLLKHKNLGDKIFWVNITGIHKALQKMISFIETLF
jgi:LmbE family N-acetylglucosaminyl deacetylase